MNKERDSTRLKAFGKHVRELRKLACLSQDDVVENCDITKGNLSNIENGHKDFYFTTLLELAKGLSVTPKELLDY